MEQLTEVYNHIVLPPELPGQQDTNPASVADGLVTRLLSACKVVRSDADSSISHAFHDLYNSLISARELNKGRLDKEDLLKTLAALKVGEVTILHITEQNASLLIRLVKSEDKDAVVFEAFEASAPSATVLDATNALQWDFPGRAVQMSRDNFSSQSFQECLVTFLERASVETLQTFQASVKKAGVTITEVRDVADPALISQMLMSLLEALGENAEVPLLRKRIRDDINFRSSQMPWRRHPFWLVLRVATQRQLCLALGAQLGRLCYKLFMGMVHVDLLRDTTGHLAPELVSALRAKVCRRISKIEVETSSLAHEDRIAFKKLFDAVKPKIEEEIKDATTTINAAWSKFKTVNKRPVVGLPRYAAPEDTSVGLINSRHYFNSVLASHNSSSKSARAQKPRTEELSKVSESQKLAEKYMKLSKKDQEVEQVASDFAAQSSHGSQGELKCADLAARIFRYIADVYDGYKHDPEHVSLMLLNVFELWVAMDMHAVKSCRELRHYSPMFSPELLDALQLPNFSEMKRLQTVQRYLATRVSACESPPRTIFSNSGKASFAVRFYDSSTSLKALRERIHDSCNAARESKKSEWERMRDKYTELSTKMEQGTCICSVKDKTTGNSKGCYKCFLWRERRRLKVKVHEDYLPNNDTSAAIVVFELGMPEYLRQYRDATWKILHDLTHPSRISDAQIPHELLLSDYQQLKSYGTSGTSRFTLASKVKSFYGTHYRMSPANTDESNVLLPMGPKFEYYDMCSKQWLGSFPRGARALTIQHLCGVSIPQCLETVFPLSQHPPTFGVDNSSSYHTQANRPKCPRQMPVHEFSTYQKLLGTRNLRWPTILAELGSSNLNLSSADTMLLLSELAVQAGPQDEGDALREIHTIFKDAAFVDRLMEQLAHRLSSIKTNRGEPYCMELIINLSLRLRNLLCSGSRCETNRLVESARLSALDWTLHFRDEVESASDSAAAKRAAQNAAWAALLCRKTFSVHLEASSALNAEELAVWVKVSVSLQDALPGDLESVPAVMHRLFTHDAQLASRLEPLLRLSINTYPGTLVAALVECSTNTGANDTNSATGGTFSNWEFLNSPHTGWVCATIVRNDSCKLSEDHMFNFVAGMLLVNGKALGKLPQETIDSPDTKELFGDRHLHAYPSKLPGMTHRLRQPIEGNFIHFGRRGPDVIIRAESTRGLQEFVPRRVFLNQSQATFDVPKELLDCVHWLNFRTEEVEFRRKPDIWRPKSRDWILSLRQEQVTRGRVSLICPYSRLSTQIHKLIQFFEVPGRITAYQPERGSINVSLRDLELSFFVNQSGLLECRELRAEIDPNQDAGTWYGFQSKIVVRDIRTGKRSILVPLDLPTFQRHGIHVVIKTTGFSGYGRYDVDETLSRLNCPLEPRLLYMKALLHALTSFVIPDPLTGKTGTEEAISILASAAAQPWSPLSDLSIKILEMLRSLSPKREYYPKDHKMLQSTFWNESLTRTIQHDALDRSVQEITTKAHCMKAFTACDDSLLASTEVPHLRVRGEVRRLLRERHTAVTDSTLSGIAAVLPYTSRDRETGTHRSSAVLNIVSAIHGAKYQMQPTKTYYQTLVKRPLIGGIGDNVELISSSLASILNCNVGEHWFGLVDLCAGSNKQQLAFTLSTLAFNRSCCDDTLGILAAYGCIEDLNGIEIPEHPSFTNLQSYGQPSTEEVMQLMSKAFKPCSPDPTHRPSRRVQKQRQYEHRCKAQATRLIQDLLSQWPSPDPDFGSEDDEFIDCQAALEEIVPDWQRRLSNSELRAYVEKVQLLLTAHQSRPLSREPVTYKQTAPEFVNQYAALTMNVPVTLESLAIKNIVFEFSDGSDATIQDCLEGASSIQQSEVQRDSKVFDVLRNLLQDFTTSTDRLRSQYATDLLKSLAAAESAGHYNGVGSNPSLRDVILPALRLAKGAAKEQLELVKTVLHRDDARFAWLDFAHLWPAETFTDLLMMMRSTGVRPASKSLRAGLIALGTRLTMVQRLQRINAAIQKKDDTAVNAELSNRGHQNWDVAKYSDWLLIEIDSDILIRAEQVEVANAIINPMSGDNSVLQMNMGKGKTSCIVPMALSVLANRSCIARLIVPRALIFQTAQVLQSRLGNLVGREVSHLVFTRRTPATPGMIDYYRHEHNRALASGGIILTSVENILSFKLNGWQLLSDGKIEVAHRLLEIQHMLAEECRDIIDESDFTLGVKTQLIYPSGAQTPVDGNPWRWEVAETLFSLVEAHLEQIRNKYTTSVVVVDRKPGFPIINFLRRDPQDELQQLIVDDIASGRTSIFQFSARPTVEKSGMVSQVLTSEKLDEKLFKKVVRMSTDQNAASKSLLTARGLLCNSVIFLCLRKRWNVRYGLSLERSAVAVPFEGKGVPSERAEFGHPDVAISLTCLSFYYQGLSLDQFREDLQRVLRSDDPTAEFERWVGATTLPSTLSQWNLINMEDRAQIGKLWIHLRVERTVINHYLNHFVFPIHTKQFELKLQASACDIPLISKNQTRSDTGRSTGFSGTNDNKILLPATIKQDDLPSLQQINAEVLSYLLKGRCEYEVAASGGIRLTEDQFLRRLHSRKIKILIDAGAYILEMTNKELVEAWLKIDSDAKAAVYFGSDHRIWVKYRNKDADVPLVATPFADNLSECLVYLDESHTRGVDLKLPPFAKGALTLALGQTKDHTVQAAMRLRQLGTTQDIHFFAPPDVHQSILDICKPAGDNVDSSHVVLWSLEQTCRSNEDLLGLHFSQGIEFCYRKDIEWQYEIGNTDDEQRNAILNGLRRPESRTLAQMYGYESSAEQHQEQHKVRSPLLRKHRDNLVERRSLYGNKEVCQDALEEVEQERELEFQVEEEREVQEAKPYKALDFLGLHLALQKFARTGRLDKDCGFQSVFETLSDTDTGKKYQVCPAQSTLLVSEEFNRSVDVGNEDCLGPGDDYMRPVEWILWSPKSNTAIVIIPEEAELLLPALKSARTPATHLICYAAPVTRFMRHFSNLQYYAIPSLPSNNPPPSWLATQVGILAGRMYFDAAELTELKQALGATGDAAVDAAMSIDFSPNQSGFLLEWLALRRNTRDILHTPMGFLCLGRALTSSHPFFGEGA